MTKLASIKFLILFFIVSSACGQKVKYKDIWGLLSTKQYDAAEPFLKKYLQEEKSDNPNALLYMGIIFQEKSLKGDLLKQTSQTIAYMDSAVIFYDRAYKTITEKEIKRNDEYYQAYNRRDLRTGEFGVKLSDIQFDLEKKMEGLRERIDRVKMVKHYFSLSDSLYVKSNELFKTIQAAFPGEKELYLRAEENTVKDLSLLSVRFDSCLKAFDLYKSSSSTIGRLGYNQTLSLQEIVDFKKDGTSVADFYKDDLQIWDYKKFTAKAKQTIEGEIFPMREQLVSYDIEINKLREKLNHDSVSVKTDLAALIDRQLLEKLRKYDAEPLPVAVFALKISDLEYRSTVFENRRHADSADVHLQLSLLRKEFMYLNTLDSITTKLSGDYFDSNAANYEYFVKNTYDTITLLKSYIVGLKDYAQSEKKIKEEELARRMESLRWLINGADSIPLFQGGSDSRYKALVVVDEKYTVGLHYTDSLDPAGYLFNINSSRVPTVKVSFPVEKQYFELSSLDDSKAISYSDAAGQIYFILIFSEHKDDESKVGATLAKIYRSDGLSWSMNYKLDFVPRKILFDSASGELAIHGDDNQLSTMDKNGKLIN
ncbi:MAG: hypothetical protein OEV74_02120 [Cyclobacteriaceae bacterium]|nr:hypothetical protein [Cyclobacteriaceae bacterium]